MKNYDATFFMFPLAFCFKSASEVVECKKINPSEKLPLNASLHMYGVSYSSHQHALSSDYKKNVMAIIVFTLK